MTSGTVGVRPIHAIRMRKPEGSTRADSYVQGVKIPRTVRPV